MTLDEIVLCMLSRALRETSYATRDCEYVNSETTKKEHTQKSKEYNTEKANNTKPKKQTRNNTTKKALLDTLGNLATSLGDVKDMFCFGFLSTCTLKHEPFVSGAYRHARRAPCRMPAGMHKVSNRRGNVHLPSQRCSLCLILRASSRNSPCCQACFHN